MTYNDRCNESDCEETGDYAEGCCCVTSLEQALKLLEYGRTRYDAMRILALQGSKAGPSGNELASAAEYHLQRDWKYGIDYM